MSYALLELPGASERSVNYLLALSSFVLPVLALPFVIHKHRHLYNTHTHFGLIVSLTRIKNSATVCKLFENFDGILS